MLENTSIGEAVHQHVCHIINPKYGQGIIRVYFVCIALWSVRRHKEDTLGAMAVTRPVYAQMLRAGGHSYLHPRLRQMYNNSQMPKSRACQLRRISHKGKT